MTAAIRVRDVVDGAALLEFPGVSEDEGNARAVSIARALKSEPPRGFLAAVPGAETLLLLFEPRALPADLLQRRVSQIAAAPAARLPERHLQVPVLYGGPDLDTLAAERRLTAAEFARRHAAGVYRVAFLGFAPGFGYLSGLDPELHAPRLSTPRTRVPAGSVAIGGPYTGIYPQETPGGWRLIGRSPVRLFDEASEPPALFAPGDQVSFEPIGETEFQERAAGVGGARTSASSGRPIWRVQSAGLFSSVQGEPNYRWIGLGVPPGGSMDPAALTYGNSRLGNPRNAPVLEITATGPQLEALESLEACLSGADAAIALDGRAIASGEVFSVSAGQRLVIGAVRNGLRCYLCVRGGLAAVSRLETRRVKSGDTIHRLEATTAEETDRLFRGQLFSPAGARDAVVRVVLAPPDLFTADSIERFLATPYRVSSASDRRGIRLEGAPLVHQGGADVPPEGTAPGAVQVPRDGMPIVLGPDRPVTGGYAKVATVIGADLSVLAQAAPGTNLRFTPVGVAEALEARVRMERP